MDLIADLIAAVREAAASRISKIQDEESRSVVVIQLHRSDLRDLRLDVTQDHPDSLNFAPCLAPAFQCPTRRLALKLTFIPSKFLTTPSELQCRREK